MSADIINREKQLPVWTVHGVNFHVDVPMDEYNAEFDQETQAYEAASMALWAFKGHCDKCFVVMDEGETVPFLGPVMITHLKGVSPNKGFMPFTHVVLANQGFYKESARMQILLEADIEKIKQDQIQNENAQIKIEEHLKKLKKPPEDFNI